MNLTLEIFKFIIYAVCIVIISKYVLVKLLRKIAENLKLSAKTIGNITGIATSVPEFLTVFFSAFAGFLGTSLYNILSSNIINFFQYSFAIYINNNQKNIRNKAIKINIFMVILTIVIPILMIITNINFSISIVPIFILLFILFYYINSNVYKLYLNKYNKELYKENIKKSKNMQGKIILIKNILFLTITTVVLYIIGNSLSKVLTNLCNIFNIPEIILGILLGFITSLPELITFFESQKHYNDNRLNELGVIEASNNLLISNILNLFIIQSIGIIIFTFFS